MEIPGTLRLFPRQPEIPLGETGATAAFCRNESVYTSSALYPPRPGGAVSTHYFNGYPVAMGAFTPVLYYPAQGGRRVEACFSPSFRSFSIAALRDTGVSNFADQARFVASNRAYT